MNPFECPTCGQDDAQCLDGLPCDRCATAGSGGNVRPVTKPAGDFMNPATTFLAAALLAALAGCGGGDNNEPATAEPAKTADREAALKTAIEGYANAQLAGDIAGVTGYLNPDRCTEDDKGAASMAAGIMKDTAKGAKITITAVKIEGDRGTIGSYELSKGAPDALRRILKSADTDNKGRMGWAWVDGEWYFDGICDGETPTP